MTILELIALDLVRSAPGRKPRSVRYQQEIAATFQKYFPRLQAQPADISETDVHSFVAGIAHFSTSRFNALVSLLRRLVPAGRSVRLRPLRPKDLQLPDAAAFARLLQELDRGRSHAGLMVRLLAHTGLRMCEARALRWADVTDLGIHVPATAAKNGRARLVPLVPGALEVLAELRALAKCDRVWPQVDCRKALRLACKRAGIPRLTHHDLRHLFATRCIQSGVDLPTVARWLGHVDGGALCARMYFHLLDAHSLAMAQKVAI